MEEFKAKNQSLYSAFFDFGSLGFVDLFQMIKDQNGSY
jgi:hypothetical protein